MLKRILVLDRFYPQAKKLRSYFDDCFSNPKAIGGDRFVWDYWHVADQYTLLRTPAYVFFPKNLYEHFHRYLVRFGQENLGCHDISPTWLSCYIDGCEQKLHADLPHGPWAFVFSLTPSGKQFEGGQTFLLNNRILNYWQNFDNKGGIECGEIFEKIEPAFNRLTVFDPRIPHGVEKVKGVHDVCNARLVIHGWFVNPKPFVKGPFQNKNLKEIVDGLSEELGRRLNHGSELNGLLTIRFNVDLSGKIVKPKILSNTLQGRDSYVVPGLVVNLKQHLKKLQFRRQPKKSLVTIPLFFETNG